MLDVLLFNIRVYTKKEMVYPERLANSKSSQKNRFKNTGEFRNTGSVKYKMLIKTNINEHNI